MESANKRGIVIYDLAIDGDTDEVFELQMLLRDYASKFKDYLEEKNPELAKSVVFEQTQAGVPMAERRGETGPIKDIVFRGSRGTNSPVSLPQKTKDGTPITPGVKKRLQSLRRDVLQSNSMSVEQTQQLVENEAEFMMKLLDEGSNVSLSNAARKLLDNLEATGKIDK